jgi:regulator of replication initiation timing
MTESSKTQQISESIAASKSKSDLIEKIVFASIPILFSCIVYLMTTLSAAHNQIGILGMSVTTLTTQSQTIKLDISQLREQLNNRIVQVERDSAAARANIILDREKALASTAAAASAIRAEATAGRAELSQRLAIIENEMRNQRERRANAR